MLSSHAPAPAECVDMDQPPLDLSALRNTVASLDGAIGFVADDPWFNRQPLALRNTLLAGVIQNFEFVYELSVKMPRRELDRGSDTPGEIDAADFRDMLRIAAERGLIDNIEAWFGYRQMRNLSAHTYDQTKAWQVYRDTRPFLADARMLLARLEARNA